MHTFFWGVAKEGHYLRLNCWQRCVKVTAGKKPLHQSVKRRHTQRLHETPSPLPRPFLVTFTVDIVVQDYSLFSLFCVPGGQGWRELLCTLCLALYLLLALYAAPFLFIFYFIYLQSIFFFLSVYF